MQKLSNLKILYKNKELKIFFKHVQILELCVKKFIITTLHATRIGDALLLTTTI